MSQTKILELLVQYFGYLSCLGNQECKPDPDSLRRYITEESVIRSNGEILCEGIDACVDYILQMQAKYSKVTYLQLDEPIVSGDKAVVHFRVDCNHVDLSLEAIAIVTFRDGKISYWNEVFHDL